MLAQRRTAVTLLVAGGGEFTERVARPWCPEESAGISQRVKRADFKIALLFSCIWFHSRIILHYHLVTTGKTMLIKNTRLGTM